MFEICVGGVFLLVAFLMGSLVVEDNRKNKKR